MLRERLIQMPNHFLRQFAEVRRPDDDLVVIRFEFLCDHARIRKFAECLAVTFKSHGVGFDGLVHELTHQRDNRA